MSIAIYVTLEGEIPRTPIMHKPYRIMQVYHLSQSAAAKKAGCTGVGIAPSLCDKALMNGQKKVLLNPIGQGNTMRNNELKANHINWR